MTDATLSPFGAPPCADLHKHITCPEQLTILEAGRRLFAFQHPVLGDNSRCATGELYVTYGVITDNEQQAWAAAEATLVVLSQTVRALQVPQGSEPAYWPVRALSLYWRMLPQVEPYDRDKQHKRWCMRMRCCVSEQRVEGAGQLLNERVPA